MTNSRGSGVFFPIGHEPRMICRVALWPIGKKTPDPFD